MNIEQALEKLGVQGFRPGQEEVISEVLKGRDGLAVMPTGYGKSLCFQLPALVSEGTTLVMSPLIALMRDQVQGLVRVGVAAETLNSHLEDEERQAVLKRIRSGIVRLLYLAPEQLYAEDLGEALKGLEMPRIIADEAHCISQWGHDFRPAYRGVTSFLEEKKIDQRVGFTATASDSVAADIQKSLKMKDPFYFSADLYRPNLDYQVSKVDSSKEKARRLLDLIKEFNGNPGGILVYCSTRQEAVDLFDFLQRRGLSVAFYHGGMNEDRVEVEKQFLNNEVKIMVATNAFGMGVDKPDVRLLVHFNIPGNVESYIQETGRAGRDGKDARCVLFYMEKDERLQEFFDEDRNPRFNLVNFVYNVLRVQASDAEMEVFLPLDYKKIERELLKFSRGKSKNPVPALGVLQELGVIEMRGRRFKLCKGVDRAEVEAYFESRNQRMGDGFKKMLDYAKLDNPDQRQLIQLLKV